MKPYFERDGIVIYNADCRDVLPTLDLSEFGAVVTDPPYPGYVKGWDVPDVGVILTSIPIDRKVVFWPPLADLPLPVPAAEHIWHKPNGQSAHHYERVLVYGEDAPHGCKVFRVAAILPNYVQFAHEAVDHPTQKPVRLMRDLIARYTTGAILEPFAGSGTTLRAAADLGRRCIGIEIEERYCFIAAQRLSQAVLPFDAAPDEPKSEERHALL